MTTATYEETRQTFTEAPITMSGGVEETVAPEPATVPRRSAAPVLAMAAGLAVLVSAGALTLLPDRAPTERPTPPAAATAAPAAGPRAITLAERDVSIVTQVYDPGHDSGWHTHPGIHAVAILSGALTVYDGECRATTYGPGQPYIGGRELHLVRNEAAVPVEMSVTYLNPSAPTTGTQRLSAPAGCVIPA